MNGTRLGELHALLGEELDLADDLLHALHDERDALAAREIHALGAIAARKEALVRALDGLGTRQHELLHAQGLRSTDASRDWLAHGAPAPIARAWARLAETLASCRGQNDRNGGVARLLDVYAGRLLDLLARSEDRDALYGPQGNRQLVSPTRYTASA